MTIWTRRGALAAALLASPLAWAQQGPTAAQAPLPKDRLVIVGREGQTHEFQVEMATTADQQAVGLMFRPSVPEGTGMLFVWGAPIRSQMWMRNTVASLDMVFIGPDGRVARIAERTTPQSLAIVDGGPDVKSTLELAAGVTEKLDIRVGDRVLHRVFGTAP